MCPVNILASSRMLVLRPQYSNRCSTAIVVQDEDEAALDIYNLHLVLIEPFVWHGESGLDHGTYLS